MGRAEPAVRSCAQGGSPCAAGQPSLTTRKLHRAGAPTLRAPRRETPLCPKAADISNSLTAVSFASWAGKKNHHDAFYSTQRLSLYSLYPKLAVAIRSRCLLELAAKRRLDSGAAQRVRALSPSLAISARWPGNTFALSGRSPYMPIHNHAAPCRLV